MNTREIQLLLARMATIWPQKELTSPEVDEWRRTLVPLGPEVVARALDELKEGLDWMPTHHQLLTVAQDCARRLASANPDRSLPAGASDDGLCHRCGNTGWAQVEVRAGGDAVERCRCSKGRLMNRGLDEEHEHPSRCMCHVCTLGAGRAVEARRGRADDPLSRVGDGVATRMPFADERF